MTDAIQQARREYERVRDTWRTTNWAERELGRLLDNLIAVVERETRAAMPCLLELETNRRIRCEDSGYDQEFWCPTCTARAEKEKA